MRLTKRVIDAARFDPAGPIQQIIWDSDLPGFGLRLQPGGTRTFVLKYRAAGSGRTRMLTIGRYGVLTAEQARALARQHKVQVAAGKDPAEERQEAKRRVTLREFAEAYLERVETRGKRSATADRSKLERDVLPRYGSRPLASITRADIASIHARVGKRAPYAANRLAALLSAMRSAAIEMGHLPEDAPSWRVEPFPERSRDRWVTPQELPALLAAIEAEESPHVRAAFLLALLTGMRRGEILGLRWSYVDLDRRVISLPTTKAGRSHTVPLVDDAVELLRGLPRFFGNPYVLPSPTVPGAPMHDLKRPWDRVRARIWLTGHPEHAARLRERAEADVAGRSKHAERGPAAVEARLLRLAAKEAMQGEQPALRLHDVRRTTGSMLAMSGASLPLIGAVLNHSNASTTQIYARLTQDAPRLALETVAATVRAARAAC